MLAAGPPSGLTTDGVGCWGGALWRACNLTSFSPCLTGPVDYLFASHHNGPWFNSPGGYLCETGILPLALSRYNILHILYLLYVLPSEHNTMTLLLLKAGHVSPKMWGLSEMSLETWGLSQLRRGQGAVEESGFLTFFPCSRTSLVSGPERVCWEQKKYKTLHSPPPPTCSRSAALSGTRR